MPPLIVMDIFTESYMNAIIFMKHAIRYNGDVNMGEKKGSKMISQLETVRKILKEQYTYGCFPGEDYQEKLNISKRKYDNEIKRLGVYVDEKQRGQLRQGKYVIHHLLYDRYENEGNFLYSVYKMKRYKDSHLLLYFFGLHQLSGLEPQKWIDLKTFIEDVSNMDKGGDLFIDKKAIEDFLKNLESDRIIKKRQNKKWYEYLLAENLFDQFEENDLLKIYYMAELFAGKSLVHSAAAYHLRESIKCYLQGKGKDIWEEWVFIIQFHFLQGILNEEIMWKLEEAIHQGKQVRIIQYSKKDETKPFLFEPVSLVVEYMYGRQYVYGRHVDRDCAVHLRIDRIQSVEILSEPIGEFPEKEQQEKCWCVSMPRNEEGKPVLVEVDFFYAGKEYLLNVLEREKRWGEIEPTGEFQCVYRICVNDPGEMKPWLRQFGKNARVRKSKEHTLFEEMQEDWKKMEEKYGTVCKEYEL